MKYIYLIIILSFVYKAQSQDIHKQLQRQMWYVKSDIFKGDTCSIYTNNVANCTGYLVFNENELEMNLAATNNKFACHYEILNNNMKLTYTISYKGANKKTKEVKIYYALKEMPFGKDFELIPIAEKDYK